MFRARFLSLFLLLLTASFVYGQTPGNFVSGQTLPAAQLNSALAGKQDFPSPAATNTTMSVATPAALAAATIPTPIQIIYVTSMSGTQPVTAGQSNCGLVFIRGTSTPGGLYGEILNGGIYWEPVYSTSPVKTCEFGALGDGVTDSTASLQAAIDYAIRYRFDSVCFADGNYITSDTLQLGYGSGNISPINLGITACNQGRNAYSGINDGAVQIRPTKVDRCIVNFQQVYMGFVKNIAFYGPTALLNAIGIARTSRPVSTTLNTGSNPTFPSSFEPGGVNNANTLAGGTSRNAPFGAICIDAYQGTINAANHYPNVAYPSWTGIVTQYAGNPSTDIEIINVGCTAVAVCVVTTPNANAVGGPCADCNGDFVKLDKVFCQYLAICLSIGNTQSRNVQFDNISANAIWAAYTNDTFGTQSGNTTGVCHNVHVGNGYQFFSINDSILGYFSCKGIYAEGIVRIGNFYGASQYPPSIILEDCNISTYESSVTGQSPPALIDWNQQGSLFLKSCTIAGMARIQNLARGFIFNRPFLTVDGGTFQGAKQISSVADAGGGIQQAVNYTGSLFVGDSSLFESSSNAPSVFLVWRAPTPSSSMSAPLGIADGAVQQGNYAQFIGSRRIPYTQATRGVIDRWGVHIDYAQRPIIYDLHNLCLQTVPGTCNAAGDSVYISSAASYISCDVLTFNYLASAQALGSQTTNARVGDFLYNKPTGTIFVITDIGVLSGGSYPITTRQMNNMTINSSGACITSNVVPTDLTGYSTALVQTDIFVPYITLFGDFAAGSTVVTNITGSAFGEPISGMFHSGWGANVITASSCAANVLTYTTTTAHGVALGSRFQIRGETPAGYNGYFIAATGTTGSTLQAAVAACPTVSTVQGTLQAAQGDVLRTFPYNGTTPDKGLSWPMPFGGGVASVTDYSGATPNQMTLDSAALQTGRFPLEPLPVLGYGDIKTDYGTLTLSTHAAQLLQPCQSGIYGMTVTILDNMTNVPGDAIVGGGADPVRAVCLSSNAWKVLSAL